MADYWGGPPIMNIGGLNGRQLPLSKKNHQSIYSKLTDNYIFSTIAALQHDDDGSGDSAQPPVGLASSGSTFKIVNYKIRKGFLVLLNNYTFSTSRL